MSRVLVHCVNYTSVILNNYQAQLYKLCKTWNGSDWSVDEMLYYWWGGWDFKSDQIPSVGALSKAFNFLSSTAVVLWLWAQPLSKLEYVLFTVCRNVMAIFSLHIYLVWFQNFVSLWNIFLSLWKILGTRGARTFWANDPKWELCIFCNPKHCSPYICFKITTVS